MIQTEIRNLRLDIHRVEPGAVTARHRNAGSVMVCLCLVLILALSTSAFCAPQRGVPGFGKPDAAAGYERLAYARYPGGVESNAWYWVYAGNEAFDTLAARLARDYAAHDWEVNEDRSSPVTVLSVNKLSAHLCVNYSDLRARPDVFVPGAAVDAASPDQTIVLMVLVSNCKF